MIFFCWWKFTKGDLFVVVCCLQRVIFIFEKKIVHRVSGRCEVRLSNADLSWFISLMGGTKDIFFEFHCSSSHHFPTSTPPPNFTGAMKTGPLVV